MRCLEITVNGAQYCVAGAQQDTPMISASVTYGAPEDVIERDKTTLTVQGLSGDVLTDYYWGVEKLALTPGDVVTIRVIDDAPADAPTPFPVPEFVANIRQRQKDSNRRFKQELERRPELRRLAEMDPEALRKQMSGTLRRLLFWCAAAVAAILALWFFSS